MDTKGGQAASRAPARLRFALGITAAVLAVAAGLASVLFVGASRLLSAEVEAQIRSDLGLARAAYDDGLSRLLGELKGVVSGRSSRPPLSSGEGPGNLAEMFGSLCRRAGFDVLTLVGPDGVVVESAGGLGAAGDDWSEQVLVARVLREGRAAAGTLVVPAAALALAEAGPAERAAAAGEPRVGATTPVRGESPDGLMLAAAVPWFEATDGVAPPAVLYGARLLNRDDEFVDALAERVFGSGAGRDGRAGMVALCLDDLRIAASAPVPEAARPLGTRLGDDARRQVLLRGRDWIGREPQAGAWWSGVYAPLRDAAGRVVGALYVGRPDAPYARARRATLVTTLGALGLATLAALALLLRLFRPPLDRPSPAAPRPPSSRPAGTRDRAGAGPPGNAAA